MHWTGERFLRWWHGRLNLSRQSTPSWHRDRLREELRERRLANTALRKLSETSDVIFSISRARYDGFPIRKLPSSPRLVLAYVYMIVKYTSRWKFYKTAMMLCNVPHYDQVCEVVNPRKDSKLNEVASRHRIDPMKFKKVGRRLRQIWPLLP